MILPTLLLLLMLTRFSGLTWGFPFYFHPDENNIVFSMNSLKCPSFWQLKTCFEPNFYAYGHIYIYLGKLLQILVPDPHLALRSLAALCSVLTGWFLYKLLERDLHSKYLGLIGLSLFIFSPIFIQLAHFGTTESTLMLLLVLSVYYWRNWFFQAILIGAAISIKISSVVLLSLPLLNYWLEKNRSWRRLAKIFFVAGVVFIILSPHYFLNWQKFVPAFIYEASVASGKLPVFYTQQFENSLPLLFQIEKILPYALGYPVLVLSALGLIVNLVKRKYLIPLLFITIFISSAVLYAKWARFLALSYPLFVYLAVSGLNDLQSHFGKRTRFLVAVILGLQVLYGVSYLTIYLRPDVRHTASMWIRDNLKPGSRIVSESANVVEVPFEYGQYQYQSFFLYDLDTNPRLARTTFSALKSVDYVIVPSRRIVKNYRHQQYPLIQQYYHEILDSGRFREVKKFFSFPQLIIFNKVIWTLDDENSEETMTVFDHPVIRIYERI